VAVDEFESAVGELVGEEAAGEADLVVDGFEGGFLGVGVRAEVPFVGEKIARSDAAVGEDAVSSGHWCAGCHAFTAIVGQTASPEIT
jgi:hypothetical protein